MASKQPAYPTLEEQQSNSPQQFSEPYSPEAQENLPQQGYPHQQGGYPPQQARCPPQQASYPPQQPSDIHQQASHPLQRGNYPPQQGYSPPMQTSQPPSTTVPIQEQPIIPEPVYVTYGEWPVRTFCPRCQVSVETTVHPTPGATAFLCCAVLFCIGCSFGCCLVPFCNHDCLDVVHACPICKNQIAIYQRSI